jgi:hypothetical protein
MRYHASQPSGREGRSSSLFQHLIPAALLVLTGCNLLTPLVFVGDHKKRIPAEFDKLAGSRVAVAVWLDQAVLFDYPHARFELATYISDKLNAELGQRKQIVDLVDPRDVEDFIQKNYSARVDPDLIGRKFNADYVIYVEVVRFQFRDPRHPQLLRGQIDSSVAVHHVKASPDRSRRFELTPVRCVHPDKGPVTMSATNSPLIREATYRKFAEEVARKFYEHTVEL